MIGLHQATSRPPLLMIIGHDSLSALHFKTASFSAPQGHENWVLALAYSPEGTQLASRDGSLRLWRTHSGD